MWYVPTYLTGDLTRFRRPPPSLTGFTRLSKHPLPPTRNLRPLPLLDPHFRLDFFSVVVYERVDTSFGVEVVVVLVEVAPIGFFISVVLSGIRTGGASRCEIQFAVAMVTGATRDNSVTGWPPRSLVGYVNTRTSY